MLKLLPRPQTALRLEEHYGLVQRPFGLTLDQHFVYHGRSYTAALQTVRHALDRREGLVVVTGEAGTGKTMLCRTLVQQLDPAAYVSVVLDPRVTVEDLLLHVLTDFGVIAGPAQHRAPTRHQLVRALQRFLVALIPTGACAVLVIDEAQDLSSAVLDELRLLLNFETNEEKLLQIVLVGGTALDAVLERPDMRLLGQRVVRRCVLEPLTTDEVKGYIDHRLATAQRFALPADFDLVWSGHASAERVPCHLAFTRGAIRAVARQSQGIPRRINVLCDRALDIGYERRSHTIRARTVRAAARRIRARAAAPSTTRRGRATAAALTAAAAVAFAVGAAGAGAWQTRDVRPAPALPPAPPVFAPVLAWSPPPGDVRPIEVFDRLEIWNGPLSAAPETAVEKADVRLLGVALLRQTTGVSLALEMTAEPRRAVLRTVSDTVLDIEIGPVGGPVERQELAPASASAGSLISQVSIREYGTDRGEAFVRVRVTLREPGRGDVRIVSRVVYVDVRPAGS